MNTHQNVQALTITDVATEEEITFAKNSIATLEEIVFNTGDPIAIAPPNRTGFTNRPPAQDTPMNMETITKKAGTSNPFLPAHILQQLKQDNLSLVQEIAQSGEALNASTALLRTYQRNTPSNFRPSDDTAADKRASKIKAQRYKMIDDLVDEYLPLIAADLRRKLKLQLDKE